MKARVLIIGVTMAAALLAQPQGGGFRRDGNGAPPTPQQMIQHEVARLTRFLGLSSDQQNQISGILNADTTNLTSLQANLKAERAALAAAIKSNQNVSSAAAAVSTTQGQIAGYRAAEAAAIYAILSTDQKTKVGDAVSMLSGGGGPGPGRGFGPPR